MRVRVGASRHPLRSRWATLPPMAAPERDESFVEKLSRQGEEALGKIAEELIANPVVNGAITRAFEAREKAVQAQEATLIDAASRSLYSDNPTLPIVLAGVGLAGVIGASRRWAS